MSETGNTKESKKIEKKENRENNVRKMVCTLALVGILAVCLGLFIGMIKLNAGNFASDVLAPMVGGVPIVQNILPADYVDTYSNMKPKDAAKVFDNMMKDQSELVVKILSNISSSKRASILSNMSVANASQVTVLMKQ